MPLGPDAAAEGNSTTMQLALFDLDHTLLSGDSDILWCEFLIDQGLLDVEFRERCDAVAERYAAGTVSAPEFCQFFTGLLSGYTPATVQPLRERFLADIVLPRIPADARALLARHRAAGDTLLLTTATNRVISELTAANLGVDTYLCTEVECIAGRFTGRTAGVLNMGTGKVDRLRHWLTEQGLSLNLLRSATFYSDSINDLALLSVVGRPVVVDPDPRLESTALRKGWAVVRFRRH